MDIIYGSINFSENMDHRNLLILILSDKTWTFATSWSVPLKFSSELGHLDLSKSDSIINWNSPLIYTAVKR